MHRLVPVWLALASLTLLALPGEAAAQEEAETPMVLRLSFFKCDMSGGQGEALTEEIENHQIPLWREIVAQGTVVDHGYFYHWWADEWNVGVYTIAPTLQAVIDASETINERMEERLGDAPSAFAACPEHRDGFYTMGPSAGMNGGN